MKLLLFIFLIISSGCLLTAQEMKEPETAQSFAKFTELLPFIPPLFFLAEIELKDYVRSDVFTCIKVRYGDIASVDSIFSNAQMLMNGNTSLALLVSILATNEHKNLTFKIPYIKLLIPLPLTLETKEEFQERLANLPKHFSAHPADTVHDNRDKLQHFFASAFLAYTFESYTVVDRFGLFVEEGERAFIAGGTYDDEDMQMNNIGSAFGLTLHNNRSALPSSMIK